MLFGSETSLEQLSDACLAQRDRRARGWKQTGLAALALGAAFAFLFAAVVLA